MKKQYLKEFLIGSLNMNPLIRQFSLGAVAIAMVQVANAQVNITNVVPMTTAEGTEVRVMFNGLPPQPQAYQLNDPARVVLDFPQVTQTVANSVIPAKGQEVSSIEVASDEQRSRVTVNLQEAGQLTHRIEGNSYILKVNNPRATQARTAVVTPRLGVSNINFQRGSKDEGLVVVDLLGAKTPIDVQQQGSQIVIRLLGNKLPASLLRRLNTSQYSTPISVIDAKNDGANGVITIQTTGGYEYMAYQTDNRFTVSVKRPVIKELKVAEPVYTGKKISLDFQDIGVRQVLQLLGDFTNTNIVVADNVQGNITLRLKDVPADQALDMILKTKSLDKRRQGNVIWVAPATDIIKFEKEQLDNLKMKEKLAPIQTEHIRLNYARASNILKLLQEARNARTTSERDNNAELEGLLSHRGSVVADDRTNTLIINDTIDNLDKIRKLIASLDKEVKQVMVEARVVRASTSFSKELGVKWGVFNTASANNRMFNVGSQISTETQGTGTRIAGTARYMNVDLGVATSGASSIAFGLLGLDNFRLDLELSALQADGYGEIISTPKVLTADKQKATIKTGQEIPYQTVTSSGGQTAVTTSFKEAVLQLDVTPSITPDGKVQMQLQVTNDSAAGFAQNGEIILNKNEVNTNVLVNDGETVVLGGVFEHTNQNDVSKVPFFGDLPGVGRLFRKDVKKDDKKELLIFVTPRIVNDVAYRE